VSAGLEGLYRQYGQLVRAQAIRLLGGDADADDVMQEVFLKYWRRDGGVSQDDAAALLFRMATNAAISRLRKVRRLLRLQTLGAGTGLSFDDPTAHGHVRSLLAVAGQKDAEVAALVYLGGLSQVEVVATLGMSRHEVAMRLQRFADSVRREADVHGWLQEVGCAKR
jgi:RNA polymerase sigma-70 factor (ECF subfamily)